jgi:hypothetical protein
MYAPVDDNSQHGFTPEQKIAMIRAQADLVEKQTALRNAENPHAQEAAKIRAQADLVEKQTALRNAENENPHAQETAKIRAQTDLIRENRRNQQGQEVDTFLSVSSSFDFI